MQFMYQYFYELKTKCVIFLNVAVILFILRATMSNAFSCWLELVVTYKCGDLYDL